jgi:chaperonin GroES
VIKPSYKIDIPVILPHPSRQLECRVGTWLVKVLIVLQLKEENFMAVPIQPLSDYVVAEAEVASTKTASGLYLPDSATEKPKIAKVVAVGPGRIGDDNERVPMTLKVGDKIVYKSYSTTDVKLDKTEYILVREEDVLATVK